MGEIGGDTGGVDDIEEAELASGARGVRVEGYGGLCGERLPP